LEEGVVILEVAPTLEGLTAGLAAADSELWDMRSIIRIPGTTGIYGPFDYGIDDYDGPYNDDTESVDLQPAPTDLAPDGFTSLTMSVQKVLAQLGYYHGPINGIAGSETAHAIRWFQSVDHLPVNGQMDSATIQALRVG
jgi:peptidoglycan hydrolase-like protein with peptidoglycan-binding domain